jgi:predicted esterase
MDPPTLARRELLRLAGGALWLPLGASIASPLVALAASAMACSSCPSAKGPCRSSSCSTARAAPAAGLSGCSDPWRAELGCAVLAPDSRGATWDAVTGAFGADVRFLEPALADAARRCEVAPGRVAAAGFSDGATYALALGRANGDRFSHLLAFSPGFLIPARRVGSPRIFVSHGRQDDVLPIASCSRVMVPRLRRDGYEVRYREFEGGHEAPLTVMREGVGFLLEGGNASSSRGSSSRAERGIG